MAGYATINETLSVCAPTPTPTVHRETRVSFAAEIFMWALLHLHVQS